jgi:hypothetical protein
MAKFQPDFYARPFTSFTRPPPSFILNYDASLTGLGVRISKKAISSEQYSLVAFTSMSITFPGIKGDPSYQNMCEYLAVLLGLLLLRHMGTPKSFAYILLGDSMASLTWMLKQTTNSIIAHNAHVGLTLVSIALDAQVADAFWLSSEDNFIADGLSRGVAGSNLGLPPHLYYPVRSLGPIEEYINLCDPSKDYTSATETLEISRRLLQLLQTTEFVPSESTRNRTFG